MSFIQFKNEATRLMHDGKLYFAHSNHFMDFLEWVEIQINIYHKVYTNVMEAYNEFYLS